MVEKVISFETAKLARDKGFDLVTDGYYDEIGHPTYLQWNKYANHSSFSPLCTQALLQKWLREVHDMDINVHSFFPSHEPLKKIYFTEVYNKGWLNEPMEEVFVGNTYESALEAGLIEALNLI